MQIGVVYAALAYTLWGLFPLFFKQLAGVGALEVVLHRFVWSLVFVLLVLAVLRRWAWLRAVFRTPRVVGTFALSATLLAGNWLVYIWAVNNDHVLDASLGYFILPLVNVTTNLVNFLLSLPILLLFMAVMHVPYTLNLLFLPLLIVVQFLLTLGISLILCTLNTFFRDVEQLLGPILLAWFYVTPVIYQASSIPTKFKFLYYVNPVAPLMASYQRIFYEGQPPSMHHLLYCTGVGAAIFLVGYATFYSKKFSFAETV